MIIILLFVFGLIFSRKPMKVGTEIALYANHVGPTSVNPHETYRYFDYPFCIPDEPKYKFPSIGEALQGMELVETMMKISFREPVPSTVICHHKIDEGDFKKFSHAMEHQYWYQYYVDELPVFGLIGKYDPLTSRYYVYTHRHFIFGFNKENYVVEVDLEPQKPVLMKEDSDIVYTYSVEWVERDISYGRRFERYLDNKFYEHQIHWFSLLNSTLMVLFLSGLMVMVVYRTIRSDLKEIEDFKKMDSEYEDDIEEMEAGKGKGKNLLSKTREKLKKPLRDFDNLLSFTETGWKKLSSDVFRAPRFVGLFAALIGTGIQLTLLVFVMIMIAIVFTFYDEPGTMMTTFIIFYVITSVVSGFASGSFYLHHSGKNWIRTMLITSTFFPAILILGFGVMNFFALMYQSSQAIPFKTIGLIFCIQVFLTTPLVCIGTLLGRAFNSDPDFPCQPQVLKRQIPQKPFYSQRVVVILAGGILPFGSIFIELYFVFSSFQTYKIYYVYGFFLAVFVILIIVTICVSVVLTYVLLVSEDWRWPWTIFFSTATTGIYTFIYALFFYQNTNMEGLFEFVYYISHCLLFSFTISLICGAVGFYSSYRFVRRIYKDMKYD